MPEGDTIYRAARTLHRALSGRAVTAFETVLPQLSRVDIDTPIAGRTVEKAEARGKWLLIHFSASLILLTHMRMNGSWHIYRPGETWKRRGDEMRIVISTKDILAVAFAVQVAEFHTPESLLRRDGFNELGPSLLEAAFDESNAIARLREHASLEIGIALLAQSIFAGVGNVYKSEVCFACGVNPFRLVGSLTGEERACVVSAARKLLLANVTDASSREFGPYAGMRRTTGRSNPSQRLWVYQRRGEPCLRCGTAIQSGKQGSDARATFWCPRCQP